MVTCRARSSSVASASRVASSRSGQPTSGASSRPRKAPPSCPCSQAHSSEPRIVELAPEALHDRVGLRANGDPGGEGRAARTAARPVLLVSAARRRQRLAPPPGAGPVLLRDLDDVPPAIDRVAPAQQEPRRVTGAGLAMPARVAFWRNCDTHPHPRVTLPTSGRSDVSAYFSGCPLRANLPRSGQASRARACLSSPLARAVRELEVPCRRVPRRLTPRPGRLPRRAV